MMRNMSMWIRAVNTLIVVGAFVVSAAHMGGCGEEFRCTKDFDCDDTEVCNTKTGQCEQLQCEVDDDCVDSDQVCQSNTCVVKTAAAGS